MKQLSIFKTLRKTVILLVLLCLLTSCGTDKPGGGYEYNAGDGDNTGTSNYEDWLLGGKADSADNVNSFEGKSEALDYSPCEGVWIKAPENSLYEGTVLKMEAVEGKDERIDEIGLEMVDNDYLMLKAWDIDAGLEPDATIPGYLDLTIDLDTLGIDESMYPNITAFRIDGNDNLMEYDVKVEENKAYFRTNQNSSIVLSIGLFTLVGVLGLKMFQGFENREANKYFKDRNKQMLEFDSQNSFGSYVIQYAIEDIEPKLVDKYYRIAELEVECFNDAYQQYLKSGGTEIGDKNASIKQICENNAKLAGMLDQKLKANKELNELKKSIEEPEIITYTKRCIDIAYAYLAIETQVHLPLYKVEFKCQKNAGPLGEATNRNFSQGYIILRPASLISGDKETRDDYLLTITHELFHLCQNRYRSIGAGVGDLKYDTDLTKFDELGAPIVERDAFEFYKKKGYITTNPSLTPTDYWGSLAIPMNVDYEDKNVQIGQGYNLADFAEYIMKVKNKEITGKTLMDLRPYFTKPDIADILCKSFEIKQEDLGQLWEDYITANAEKIDDQWYDQKLTSVLVPATKAIAGKQLDIKLNYDGNYKMVMRGFGQDNAKQEMPYLIIVEPWTNSAFKLLLTDEHVEIPEGYYAYGYQAKTIQEKYHIVLEIYKYFSYNTSLPKGYTFYAFDKSEKPKLSQDYLEISLEYPKVKNEEANKVIDGFEIKVKFPDGKVMTKHYTNDPTGKYINILKTDIADFLYKKGEKKKNVKATVTVCEYVKDEKGERYYGVESDPSEITIEFEEKEDNGNGTPYVETNISEILPLAGDGFSGFEYYDYYDAEYKPLSQNAQPSGNYYSINGDQIHIHIENLNYNEEWKSSEGKTVITYTRDGFDLTGTLYEEYNGGDGDIIGRIDIAPSHISAQVNEKTDNEYGTEIRKVEYMLRDVNLDNSGFTIAIRDGSVKAVRIDIGGNVHSKSHLVSNVGNVTDNEWDTDSTYRTIWLVNVGMPADSLY